MLTRTRLLFLVLVSAMLFVALAPGPIIGTFGSGDNRHFLVFLLLPLVSATAWPRLALPWQFAAYSALGGAIELGQGVVHSFHRPEWGDWLVDIAAAGIALAIVGLVRRRRRG